MHMLPFGEQELSHAVVVGRVPVKIGNRILVSIEDCMGVSTNSFPILTETNTQV